MGVVMSKDTPAFPNDAAKDLFDKRGMTLRDYFAAKAMQGMLAACTGWSEAQQERLAKCSYAMADEMMKAREA
jgi:hypothetical protein